MFIGLRDATRRAYLATTLRLLTCACISVIRQRRMSVSAASRQPEVRLA